MAQLSIQPKKQDNRMSSGGWGWRQQGRGWGGGQNLIKDGEAIEGGYGCKIGGLVPLCKLCFQSVIYRQHVLHCQFNQIFVHVFKLLRISN